MCNEFFNDLDSASGYCDEAAKYLAHSRREQFGEDFRRLKAYILHKKRFYISHRAGRTSLSAKEPSGSLRMNSIKWSYCKLWDREDHKMSAGCESTCDFSQESPPFSWTGSERPSSNGRREGLESRGFMFEESMFEQGMFEHRAIQRASRRIFCGVAKKNGVEAGKLLPFVRARCGQPPDRADGWPRRVGHSVSYSFPRRGRPVRQWLLRRNRNREPPRRRCSISHPAGRRDGQIQHRDGAASGVPATDEQLERQFAVILEFQRQLDQLKNRAMAAAASKNGTSFKNDVENGKPLTALLNTRLIAFQTDLKGARASRPQDPVVQWLTGELLTAVGGEPATILPYFQWAVQAGLKRPRLFESLSSSNST